MTWVFIAVALVVMAMALWLKRMDAHHERTFTDQKERSSAGTGGVRPARRTLLITELGQGRLITPGRARPAGCVGVVGVALPPPPLGFIAGGPNPAITPGVAPPPPPAAPQMTLTM